MAAEVSPRHRPPSSGVEKPWLEPAVGAAVALVYFALRSLGEHVVVLDGGGRASVYQLIAAAAVGLVALGLAPAAILFALTPGARLKAVLTHHSRELRSTITGCLWWLIAVIVVSIGALALDQNDPGQSWIRYTELAVAAAALVSLGRLLLVFGRLLVVIDSDRIGNDKPVLKEVKHEVRAG